MMNRFYFLVVVTTMISVRAYSQCPSGDAAFATQASIDAFASSGCTRVDGNLIISGSDITNVDGLKGIEIVKRHLYIYNNPLLENVDGLVTLDSIGGMFSVFQNSALTDIDSLANIQHLGAWTQENLSIEIRENPALESINAFKNLKEIIGTIAIEDNDALLNIDGLDSVKIANGRGVFVVGNARLLNIDGLQSLQKAFGVVGIWQNSSLMNANGLSSLELISSYGPNASLIIDENPVLTSINLSPSLRLYGAPGGLVVEHNPMLNEGCSLYPVLKWSSECENCGLSIHILDNGPEVTVEQILANGPCGSDPQPLQPTNMVFSDVTDTTLSMSFSGATHAAGYITVMRSFTSSYPEDVPVDGTEYHIGELIGYSSIVVGFGLDTTLNIVYLNPDTEYWFDVYSFTYDSIYNYKNVNPLEGHQRTSPANMAMRSAYPNPFVSNVTIPFTTVESANVKIVVYDAMGTQVAEVINDTFAAGAHEVSWDGVDRSGGRVRNGIYFYHVLKSDGETLTGRVTAR